MMDSKEAVSYRDLTADEIIALAEKHVTLLDSGEDESRWAWKSHNGIVWYTGFASKLDAADAAVCELDLDQITPRLA